MCGRFTLKATPTQLASEFDIPLLDFRPRYNIAPTQTIPVVRLDGHERVGAQLRWGLIPSWAKDKKIGNTLINGRAETAADKPSFRSAFKKRRCLIPASGFFEWKKIGTKKQPYHITVTEAPLIAFAGLWELWRGDDGEALETCTILTTDANEKLQDLHNRMPVILPHDAYQPWLNPASSKEDLLALLKPFPADKMETHAVSMLVNSTKNDSPECIVEA